MDFCDCDMFATMVADEDADDDYAYRVRRVVGLDNDSDKAAENQASNEIASKLSISYTAAAKVIRSRKRFGAANSAEFAKQYRVNHYWLATGKGSAAAIEFTKSGKYVAPTRSTNPDNTKINNYSSKGNVNPANGKQGTKNVYP